MLINSAFPFKSVISALLILSLIAPSILVPNITYASLGGGSDGSGGFGEGEGPDGGGSGPSGDADGGDSDGDGDSGNEGASDADGDGKSDAAESAASQAAADSVASAAATVGVEVGVAAVDTANDPTNAMAGMVSVDGKTMSVDAAMSAIGAMANAQTAGMAPATGPNAPGFSVDATLSAHAEGKTTTGVVGNLSGTTGMPEAVAHAEIDAAIGMAAVGISAAPAAAAPTNSVANALSVAAAHPALMDQTPIAQQTQPLSINVMNVASLMAQPTVTPTQSFNTQNAVVDATSFSLGSFAPGKSATPTAPDPNEGRMGLATGRMATISAQLSLELAKLDPLDAFINQTVQTPTQLAQIAEIESKIAALDARTAAMISPTVTNQAVAALNEQKAVELSALAANVQAKEDLDQVNMALDTLDVMDAVADAYDSRISAAQANTQVAQTEVENASKLAALDVDVALGITPATASLSTTPTASAVENLGLALGLSPPAASTLSTYANAVLDAVISIAPVAATISAISAYADAKALSVELGIAEQAAMDVEFAGAGITDPTGSVGTPQGPTSVSSAPSYATEMDANEDFASAGITDPTGMVDTAGRTATVSIGPTNSATVAAQATALGFQALATLALDVMGLMSFGTAGIGKTAPSASTGKAATAAPAANSVSPTAAPTAATPTATAPAVSFSYNQANNTVTLSPTAQVAANTVEGRIGPTASLADNVATPSTPAAMSVADNTVGPSAPSGMTGTANSLGKAADDVAAPAAANNNTAPSVPGVTAVDSLVGPTAATAPAANPAQAAQLSRSATQAAAQALAPTATPAQAMAFALSLTQALATPATIGRATVDAMQSVVAAISRTADDISPTAPTSISVRSADNVSPTAQAPTAQTAATQAAPTAAPTIGVTPATAVTTAQTPTVTAVPSVTAPAVTAPTTQAPATQATTPAAPTAQAPTAPTTQAQPAATNPTAPAAPTQAAPTAQAPATQAAPAASRGPVSQALSTISNIGDGIANALNELFGVKPAASQPTRGVNFANLEKTPETFDFAGAIANDDRFLSFEDNTTAARALLRDLENKIKDLQAANTTPTLNTIVPKYSPATENNPTRHANTIAAEVAKDIPGFNANTPITLENLKGPVGVALVKGFALAEEGVSLPTAEAERGVAAYAALPSIPTTLVDGVYSPTDPTDLATLNAIRGGSPAAETSPAQVPQQVQQAVQTAAKTAATIAEYSPTVIAVKATVGFLDQLVNPAPRAATPAASVPATAPTPAVAVPATQPAAAVTNVRQSLIVTTSVKGVDTRLVHIMEEAAKQFPLRVKLFSGHEGRSKGTHSHGEAVDVMIYDTAGTPIASYMVSESANVYALFAETARAVQMKLYPELNNKFVWGGAFTGMAKTPGGRGTYGGADFMDFRVGGAIGTNQMQAYKFGQGWQDGFAYYTANDVLGIGTRASTPADYAKLEGFQLSPAQIASQISKSKAGAVQGKSSKATQFNAGLLGHKSIGPQQTTAIGVTVVAPSTPTIAVPATTVEANPAAQPSTPATAQPATPASPSTPAAQPSTPSAAPTQASQPSTPTAGTPSSPGAPSVSTPADTPTTPGNNIGNPPDSLGNVGPGTAPAATPPGVIGRTGLAVYAAIAAILAAIADVITGEDESIDDNDPADDDESEDLPSNPSITNVPDVPGTNPGGQTTPDDTATDTRNPQNPLSPNQTDIIGPDTLSSSTPKTVHVMIQVDGNTGDIYFDLQGIYTGDYYEDHSYDHEEEDPEETDDADPRIILDDQKLNVIYSDGTYAPVSINGIDYSSPSDPRFVYTVEYYLDGELVSAADNVDAIPKANPVTDILNNLFTDNDTYQASDVSAVTRALIDPDTSVPADEYYAYRIYLKDGDVRGTTIPRYTSHRFMSERFAETGFNGNVLALIGISVEIPPPSTGKVASGIIKTLKSVGLSALDLFRNGNNEGNPIVTDLGSLTPSDDGIINMNDIKSVLVLLDVEAECPFIQGLTRPYLYEIVIAQTAISGAGSDEAFRAVRCGGGDKQDFVDQVANHFESFDDVGTLDRQRLSEIIRFANFKDLDMSRLIKSPEEDTTATSSPATVPEETDEETFVPNVTNEISFEVKATGSQGQTLLDWAALTSISIGSGVQLHFRWNGSAYQQCLPFLNDSGNYALTVSNRAMTNGNTDNERYDVREANTTYRVECGGQRNNEFGVDDRSIQVIIE